MFYIIGLGLGDCKDITVKGLEIVKRCSKVYLEAYTSILTCGKDELEQFYGCTVIIADRELVEQDADVILSDCESSDVALLVIGDPFGATTHTDLILRAKEKGIKYQVIHNASILSAVGCCGLQLYNFGETVSIPFWTENWEPDSFFDKIVANYERKLHTLCLLGNCSQENSFEEGCVGLIDNFADIKVKEPTLASLTKKKKEYMPPRFMSVKEAAQQLLVIIEKRTHANVSDDVFCVGLARVGTANQQIIACTLMQMRQIDFGPPLHSLIICGPELHPMEAEYIEQFKL